MTSEEVINSIKSGLREQAYKDEEAEDETMRKFYPPEEFGTYQAAMGQYFRNFQQRIDSIQTPEDLAHFISSLDEDDIEDYIWVLLVSGMGLERPQPMAD